MIWDGSGWLCSTQNDFNEEYLTQHHTPSLTMHGSGKLPWGLGLSTMCDQCRATSSLSHPITGWTLTWLTGAGQSPFCSLAVTVSHVTIERWVLVFWILLIGSRYRSALGFVKWNYSNCQSQGFETSCDLTIRQVLSDFLSPIHLGTAVGGTRTWRWK